MAIRFTHLRKYRKCAHLSQRELAYLVGINAQGQISEIEAGLKHPSLRVEACCEVVFSSPLRDLYPALYAKAENEVFERALELQTRLASSGHRTETTAYVAALIRRLEGDNAIQL